MKVRRQKLSDDNQEGYKPGYPNCQRAPIPDDTGRIWRISEVLCLEDTILPANQATQKVLVQAEEIGTAYNVEAGKITVSMVHIEGDATVTNEEDWITNEGQEKETAEHLRKRCINSRALIAERTIDRKLKSTVEEVPGVAVAYIDSQHPRGQGTVDIIVTGNSGTASPELIENVEEAVEPLTGSYGDYLVKSSTQQKQDIEITVYIEKTCLQPDTRTPSKA